MHSINDGDSSVGTAIQSQIECVDSGTGIGETGFQQIGRFIGS